MKLTALLLSPYSRFFGYDIFISYTRDGSREYAAKLYDQLTSLDYSCFLDKNEVPGGRPLKSSLTAALNVSKTLILVGTERALQREFIKLEFGEFAALNRPIIPINVDSALSKVVTLRTKPWNVIIERDLVWIDETQEAVNNGLPSPEVYEGVQNLFHFTRRNVIRRRWTTVAVLAIVIAAVVAIWQAKDARAKALFAEKQTQIAEDRKAEIERQTTKLKDEQLKLAEKNAELEGKKQELESKTAEAQANAERAREQEKLARSNAEQADRRRRAAESLYLADQGQYEFVTNPLTGLALSLEALHRVPSDDNSTRTAIERTIKDRIKYGRLARIDRDDFGRPYFLDQAPFFVLSRPGKPGEIRDLESGMPLKTLSGEVINVRKIDPSRFVPKPFELPYFIVSYKDAPSELRRLTDASVLTSGNIRSVGESFTADDPYFAIRYENTPSELRKVSNDSIAIPVSDKNGRESIDVNFVPGAPYFLIAYDQQPCEIRRVDTGEVVEKLSVKSSSPYFNLSFSKDLSLYAISYSDGGGQQRSELRRTSTNEPVTFPHDVNAIFFSPLNTQYAVAYSEAPGELRRTDDTTVTQLSGIVDRVVFNSEDHHFIVTYQQALGEIRHLYNNKIIPLPNDVRSVWVDRAGPGFNVSYADNNVVLLHIKDDDLEELPLHYFTAGERKPAYLITRNRVLGTGEIRSVATGEIVHLTGEYAQATSFRYLEDGPFIEIRSNGGQVLGLLNSITGNLISINPPGTRLSKPTGAIIKSPKETLFHFNNWNRAVYRIDTGHLVVDAMFGEIHFSPNDEYLITANRDGGDEFVWTATAKSIRLSGTVTDAAFNATSSLVRIKYEQSPTELRRTSDGQVLMTAKDVSFSRDGFYFVVTYENDQSELWGARGAIHRLSSLETGVAGVQFYLSAGRAFVWYEDRRAYLLDLQWLNSIGGAPEKLGTKELVHTACWPFTKSLLDDLDLKRFVQNASLQVCQSGSQ